MPQIYGNIFIHKEKKEIIFPISDGVALFLMKNLVVPPKMRNFAKVY